ncbi:aldo/keto reductase [Parvularcula dongshanensis]|uniref:Aryl-alcohol dehydrogenase-like predicted oxidoreductase n=1 Tax=Parvularcula dongshanensis TaxID=1173995 RepID=A0A840I2U0_9PROT|nr:aldo/keto reductase [Parvularcula dongshanensis]MBB4659159.1 aryl-alcohol dehydrogenase-like predicted oxidoreductase [Parvularcula dongshanensis]
MTGLGFGATGAWASRIVSERRAGEVLEAALAAGVRAIDTGPSYASGNAEPRLGRVLNSLAPDGLYEGERLLLSSKVGTKLGEGGRLIKDFRPETVETQIANSLSALRVSQLDVVYLHGPDEHGFRSSLPALTRLKQYGSLKAIGICADRDWLMQAARHEAVDWVMAPYNALNSHNGAALREAKANGKKIAVVAPLAQALWRRDILLPSGPAGIWYAARTLRNKGEGLTAARQAIWLRDVPEWDPVSLLLAFVRVTLSPDLILTTTTNPRHVAQSARALNRPVPPDLEAKLQGLIVS